MKLGLSLAGGGFKGIAHIGAIKALEENNIKIDYISGTSSGSIVATLYACGYTVEEMYDIFKTYSKEIKYFDFKNIFKFLLNLILKKTFKIQGLNDGKTIYNLAKNICSKKGIYNINQIEKPLIIPAVNIINEELYVFYSKGIKNIIKTDKCNIKYISNADIAKVIQASCSYPGIFSPCNFGEDLLIDGGIAENIPWRELKKVGAEKVISIVFKNKKQKKCCNNLLEVVDKAFDIMCNELAKYEIFGTDYTIEIKHNDIGLLDIKSLEEMYIEGYLQTKENYNHLKEIF